MLNLGNKTPYHKIAIINSNCMLSINTNNIKTKKKISQKNILQPHGKTFKFKGISTDTL